MRIVTKGIISNEIIATTPSSQLKEETLMLPIIMTAFGTTSDALATYAYLGGMVGNAFPDDEIIWAYSSRMVTRELQQRENQSAMHLEEVLEKLASQGISKIVVQSLHLFPGIEFHRLHQATRQSGLDFAIGLPLFTAPSDYDRLAAILQPVIRSRPEQAILLLGHGTDHPVWTAYYSLEKILRRTFGNRLYVGVVEKSPDSSHLVDEIAEAGFTEVGILPLFLVKGLHYRRDIIGDGPGSWLSRFQRKNIAAGCIADGLGFMPGVAELIITHIASAREKLLR